MRAFKLLLLLLLLFLSFPLRSFTSMNEDLTLRFVFFNGLMHLHSFAFSLISQYIYMLFRSSFKVRLDNALYMDLVSQLCYAAASASSSANQEEAVDGIDHRTRRRTRRFHNYSNSDNPAPTTSTLSSTASVRASLTSGAAWAAELAWVLDVVLSHNAALPWSVVGQCAVVLCAHGRATTALALWDAKCMGAPSTVKYSNLSSRSSSTTSPKSREPAVGDESTDALGTDGSTGSNSNGHSRSRGSNFSGKSMASTLSLDEWISAAVAQGTRESNSPGRGLGASVDSTSRWDDAPEDCAHLVLQVSLLLFLWTLLLLLRKKEAE